MKPLHWLILVLLAVVGCGDKKPTQEPAPVKIKEPRSIVSTEETFDIESALTVGNHSYLGINREWDRRSDKVPLVLVALKEFEDRHPGWEVYNRELDQVPAKNDYTAHVYGLWVDHRPRPGYVHKPEKE